MLARAGVGARRRAQVALGDWPEARGPNRDGDLAETGLPDSWDLKGGTLLWRVPYGGRSAPIVMGNRVYVQNPSGRGAALQERVMALDADSGKVVWEYKFNIFQSDVPPHRVGWASPAADPETGNVYALGVGAIAGRAEPRRQAALAAIDRRGVRRVHDARRPDDVADHRRRPRDRQRGRVELGHAGGAIAPFHRAQQTHRRDRVRRESGGRPYDTAYAAPMIATINGTRLLICGLGDGAVHAIKAQTGEKVWSYVVSKRAINTGVVVSGNTVIISHGDENLDTATRWG